MPTNSTSANVAKARQAVKDVEIATRQRVLLDLLVQYELPIVAEVGVASGRTSEALLRERPDLTLWMVDWWKVKPGHPTRTQLYYDRAKQKAMARTEFAEGRRTIVRTKSLELAGVPLFKFDLVFIDADHHVEHVLADCAAWWPCVKPGGILCGHDYGHPRSDKDWGGGPRRAVGLFARLIEQEFEVRDGVWIFHK